MSLTLTPPRPARGNLACCPRRGGVSYRPSYPRAKRVRAGWSSGRVARRESTCCSRSAVAEGAIRKGIGPMGGRSGGSARGGRTQALRRGVRICPYRCPRGAEPRGSHLRLGPRGPRRAARGRGQLAFARHRCSPAPAPAPARAPSLRCSPSPPSMMASRSPNIRRTASWSASESSAPSAR
jgi:hypothetical protein